MVCEWKANTWFDKNFPLKEKAIFEEISDPQVRNE